jgi:hypothetical protein
MKLTTEHLSFEHGFVSIIQPDGDDIKCGQFFDNGTDSCRWPLACDEPDWFVNEIEDLCGQIESENEQRRREDLDYRAQVDADYLRGKGAK